MMLRDVARVVRSKNAGPFGLTIDIIFPSPEDLDRAAGSEALQREALARLYCVPASDLQVIRSDAARALKVSMRRPTGAGAPEDRDVYGAQQHVPLLDLEIG
jgi:hypothetical protein